MKNKYYYQCELRKKTPKGYMIDIAWIPERYAQVGKYLQIKLRQGWDNHWLVYDVRGKQKKEIVEGRSRDYLNQRTVSDV